MILTIKFCVDGEEVARRDVDVQVGAGVPATPPIHEGKLLTYADVVERLRISKRKLERYVATREIQPTKFGSRVLFTPEEIARFIARRDELDRKREARTTSTALEFRKPRRS